MKVQGGGCQILKPLYGRNGRGASRTKRAVQTGELTLRYRLRSVNNGKGTVRTVVAEESEQVISRLQPQRKYKMGKQSRF